MEAPKAFMLNACTHVVPVRCYKNNQHQHNTLVSLRPRLHYAKLESKSGTCNSMNQVQCCRFNLDLKVGYTRKFDQ
eukprot:1149036-Pelagomonas_calceolata.AAC.1